MVEELTLLLDKLDAEDCVLDESELLEGELLLTLDCDVTSLKDDVLLGLLSLLLDGELLLTLLLDGELLDDDGELDTLLL